jgi:hypothetical protein
VRCVAVDTDDHGRMVARCTAAAGEYDPEIDVR